MLAGHEVEARLAAGGGESIVEDSVAWQGVPFATGSERFDEVSIDIVVV
mgnify:CR=1 FL=1